MKVQLNTDKNIQGSESMAERVEAIATQYLERFENDLTRVEVHLSDENAGKHGSDDKHCAIEARPRNMQPIGVTHKDESVEKALRGAFIKMRDRLDTIMEQKRDHAGPRHEAIATEEAMPMEDDESDRIL